MFEMEKRGYKADPLWLDASYRGKKCKPCFIGSLLPGERNGYIYPEHNATYLQECLDNLARKGVKIETEE